MNEAAFCKNLDNSDSCGSWCDFYAFCYVRSDQCVYIDCKYCKNFDFDGTKCRNFSWVGDE